MSANPGNHRAGGGSWITVRHRGAMISCPSCSRPFKSYRALGIHFRGKCGKPSDEELFWLKVDKQAANGCWVYTGYCQRFGHGWLGELGLAHRYAWKILGHELRNEDCLLHKCDNPPCVNPDHLFIGDRRINSLDAKAKDRHARGERNKRNKLTEAQALEILANPPVLCK